MSRIAVIDCGSGNLYAVQKALQRVAANAHVFQCYDVQELERADIVLLTGSGRLNAYVDELHRLHFVDVLKEFARDHPLLATNLGMLALGHLQTESGNQGLELVAGEPREFNSNAPRVPHVGWNEIEAGVEHPLFTGLSPSMSGYFAHSFFLQPDDGDEVLAKTEHGEAFTSVISSGNVVGVQFLPENSGKQGLRFLANFLGMQEN